MPSRKVLSVEALESRLLLSGTPLPSPILDTTPTNTLELSSPVLVSGNIGSGPAGAADVDWYSFNLSQASTVTFSASPQSGQAAPVVSLYNNDTSDFSDPYDPLGHRLLAQAEDSSGGPTVLSRELALGTYFVAVSGAGNRYFNPFLADTGYAGATGAYSLQVSAASLGLSASDGPIVLATTPAAGEALDTSPLAIRVDLSSSLDPNTVSAGQTVNLLFSSTPVFDAGSTAIPLSSVSYSDQAEEIQLLPLQPLAPGYYEIVLSGNHSGSSPVLADLSGQPLGKDASHPNGQDYTAVFQVAGINGIPGAVTSDDTAATAHDLGTINGAGLIQVAGSIGSDPAYDPNSPNPNLANPAAQVNLYRLTVGGSGNYALTAEGFAGRIGSPLDPGLSLFSVDNTGHLVLKAVNDNSLNDTPATNGTAPLFFDPVLFTGLTPATYYLAVSGTGNVPDPTQGLSVGVNGVFDPNVSHSGQNGFTTGDYVLNLALQPSYTTPQVTAVTVRTDADVNATTGTPAQNAQLNAPPTVFEVQFNEPVSLQQVFEQGYQHNPQGGASSVYVSVPPTAQNASAQVFYPTLLSYNPATGLAQFLMLDAVPSGPYPQGQTPALHLSGAGTEGITDMAGNPLAGGGEVVVPFTVSGQRGTGNNPRLWTSQEPNDSLASPQPLGVLFSNEMQSNVVVQRGLSATASDTADYYSYSVLQSRQYFPSITGTGLPAAPFAIYTVASQQWVTGVPQGRGNAFRFSLPAGQYILEVGGWTTGQAPSVSYRLTFALVTGGASPPALTVGPEPAIRTAFAINPNEYFLAAAYQDLLHRPVDPGSLSASVALLNGGTSRVDVALGIETSTEYSTRFVQGLYQSLLLRSPTPQEVNEWVAALNAGFTWDQVEAAFLGSPEYFARQGGSNTAFLNALYQQVLGHGPDSTELATWSTALAQGMSREAVAGLLLDSQEASQRLVASWYQTYLHRQADAAGLAAWSTLLQQGVSDEVVLAGLLGSQEYSGKQ